MQQHPVWSLSAEHLPRPALNPWATLGFVVLAIVVGVVIGAPLAFLMDYETGNLLANNAGLVLAMTALSQAAFAIAALLLVMRRPILNQLALDRGPPRGWIDYAIAIGICIVMGSVINAFRLYVLGHDIYADLKQLAFLFRISIWPLSLLVVAVLAPIAEEMLFRGVLLPALAGTRLGFWGGAIVSTLVWTALHIGNAYSMSGMLLVFLLGIVFSWLFARTGSLRVPIAAHMFNNALACVLLQAGLV